MKKRTSFFTVEYLPSQIQIYHNGVGKKSTQTEVRYSKIRLVLIPTLGHQVRIASTFDLVHSVSLHEFSDVTQQSLSPTHS